MSELRTHKLDASDEKPCPRCGGKAIFWGSCSPDQVYFALQCEVCKFATSAHPGPFGVLSCRDEWDEGRPEKPHAWYHWVIYFNPSDYPGSYVVRAWKIDKNQANPMVACVVYKTLEEARKLASPGRVMIQRSPEDDPVIVETWI